MITKTRAAPSELPVFSQPYWVAIIISVISAVQVLGVAFVNRQVQSTVRVSTGAMKESVDILERQINSNMARQINQAISEAIARERLRVEMKKS